MEAGERTTLTEVIDPDPTLSGPGNGVAAAATVELAARPSHTAERQSPAPEDGTERPPARASGTEAPPARAEGIELVGEFQESGFDDPPCLVRRSDGQVVQLTELLYVTLEAVDARRDLSEIAAVVSERLGRQATADNIRFLLEEKLRPLGLLKLPDGSEPEVAKSNPLLALRWKFVLSSEWATNRVTAPFAALFRSPIVALAVSGFVAVSGWVLFSRGLAQGTRQALYSPGLLVMVFVLTLLSAGFHEFGHAAACRYSGGRPGVMGAGLYLVWPAFYTDVTDAYRLNRRGRLRTDLGGLYFNALFLLLAFGAWAVTSAEVFLLFVPLQLFQMLHQLLPVIRMDGYYILSDLTGVPDLFSRIKPTLKSAVPGRPVDERAARLKPWVRVVVTAWVLIVVPLLLASLVFAAIALPRMLATGWDSMQLQWDSLGRAAGDGRWLAVAAGAISVLALVLPLAGSAYMLARTGRRITVGGWKATATRPWLRGVGALAVTAAVTGLAFLWWPNGEYEPIRPGERGTIAEGISAARQISTGRPGLTVERERELETDLTLDGTTVDDGIDELKDPADEPDSIDDERSEVPDDEISDDVTTTTVDRDELTTATAPDVTEPDATTDEPVADAVEEVTP